MSMNYLTLDSAPCMEECVQVNPVGDYHTSMLEECKRYKSLLEDTFPQSVFPDVSFRIKWFNHDFGMYAEVIVIYDEEREESISQAYYIEDHLPEYWQDEDQIQITQKGE